MRPLLLPVEPAFESVSVVALGEALSSAEIELDDQPEWIRLEDDAWRESGEPSPLLTQAVGAAIVAGIDDQSLAPYLADAHFSNHARLVELPGGSHDGARAILSHTRLIAHLATTERMSATQIARVLNARDSRIRVGWREITVILSSLHSVPRVSKDDVTYLFEEDQLSEQGLFADADDRTMLDKVEAEGRRLGFGEGLGSLLKQLLPSDESPFTPYLQILHFQCSIAEFYDHAVSGAYEFKPRGVAATELFDRYPEAMVEANNPFLNNAKAVEQLDANWARSKETQGAVALAEILRRLELMGFAARKDLAATLRRAIVRKIRSLSEDVVELPSSMSAARLEALLAIISNADTGTAGILEQRVVDFASRLRHSSPEWVERGLGDPVNATNVSSKKLGDCDFMNAAEGRVVAYEAHGGRLTEVYLQAHVRTLSKTIPPRAQEWSENFGEDIEWELEVVFVAHSIASDVKPERDFEVDGVRVRLGVTTFEEFLNGIDLDHAAVDFADQLILGPLRERRTPAYVRETLLGLT